MTRILPSKEAPQAPPNGWLPAAKVRAELQRLRGQWIDQKGSHYTVVTGSSGLAVTTIRPTGERLPKKDGLIHIEWKDDLGRVVFGFGPPSPSIYTIRSGFDGKDGKKLVWERSLDNSTFHWERVQIAGDTSEAKVEASKDKSIDSKAGMQFLPMVVNGCKVLIEESKNKWRVSNVQLQNKGKGLGYRSSKRLDAKVANGECAKWGSLIDGCDDGDGWLQCKAAAEEKPKVEDAQVAIQTPWSAPVLPLSSCSTRPPASPSLKSCVEAASPVPSTSPLDSSLPATAESDSVSATSALSSESSGASKRSLPPPPRMPPPTPAQLDEKDTEELQKAKIAQINNIAGINVDVARELLVANDWDLETAIRAHVRLSAAEELLVPPPPPPPPQCRKTYVGDEVWAYWGDEWHPAKTYALQPDGLIVVQWKEDGNVSTLPNGLVAKRGESVKQGDCVIARCFGQSYFATVREVSGNGNIEVLWQDGTRTLDIPPLDYFRVPE